MCRRSPVRKIRELDQSAAAIIVSAATPVAPLSTEPVEWSAVLSEIGRGYKLKRVCEIIGNGDAWYTSEEIEHFLVARDSVQILFVLGSDRENQPIVTEDSGLPSKEFIASPITLCIAPRIDFADRDGFLKQRRVTAREILPEVSLVR